MSRRQLIRALFLAAAVGCTAAPAQTTFTWKGTNATWATATNWTPNGPPNAATKLAAFGSTGNATATINAAYHLYGITFNSGAKAFTININSGKSLDLDTAGIVNNSGNGHAETIVNSGTLNFNNSATASSASTGSAGVTIDTSATATNGRATTTFNNTSTVGSASFANTSSGDGSVADLVFNNTAGAGAATIDLTTSGAFNNYADLTFNASTAGSSTITATAANTGGFQGGLTVNFNSGSTAGSSTLNLNVTGAGGNIVTFTASDAGSAHLNAGADSTINFYSNSSASTATITQTGDSVSTTFDASSAGSAHLTAIGSINFNNASTAGSSTITLNTGNASSSSLYFTDSTAGSSTITLNGSGDLPSYLIFSGTSTAGTATINVNANSLVFFNDTSTGGSANLVLSDLGYVDFSNTTAANLSVGSFSGAGAVYLGGNQLQIGGNNSSTILSATLLDGGLFNSSTGGGITKVGTGTLELDGNSHYTGPTNVNAGKLIVNLSIASSSLTTVNSGATLTGFGYVGDLTIASGGIVAPGYSPGSGNTFRAGNTTLYGGGTLQWQIDNDYIPFGRWDHLAITGTLDLTHLFNGSGGRFNLSLQSLTFSDAPGLLSFFDPTANYSFTFLTTTGGITGFAANKFAIDTTGFQNPFSGTWSVSSDGFNLSFDYTAPAIAPVPEPGPTAALLGATALIATVVRRRHNTRARRLNAPHS